MRQKNKVAEILKGIKEGKTLKQCLEELHLSTSYPYLYPELRCLMTPRAMHRKRMIERIASEYRDNSKPRREEDIAKRIGISTTTLRKWIRVAIREGAMTRREFNAVKSENLKWDNQERRGEKEAENPDISQEKAICP